MRGLCAPLRSGPPSSPFSTEPGAWSSAFEKRDDKPKPGSTAPADKRGLATEEVPEVVLESEVRATRLLATRRARCVGTRAAALHTPDVRPPGAAAAPHRRPAARPAAG
jgi:hypothetical protein